MKNNHRWIWLILVIMLAVFFKWQSGGFYGADKRPVYEEFVLKSKSDCDVTRQPCSARSKQIEVALQFHEQPSGLKAFPVSISVKGLKQPQAAKMLLQFSMSGMDMGQLRQVLKWDESAKRWHGQVILPICSTGRRDWKVELELISDKRIYLAKFAFVVK